MLIIARLLANLIKHNNIKENKTSSEVRLIIILRFTQTY